MMHVVFFNENALREQFGRQPSNFVPRIEYGLLPRGNLSRQLRLIALVS
jgi:hypothetical protein